MDDKIFKKQEVKDKTVPENRLNDKNKVLSTFLQYKASSINEAIKPVFNFKEIDKNTKPKEYFAMAVLNKIYSLDVSLENIILTNDVFLCNYFYRYVYELYIKVLYIFSASNEEETIARLNNFFSGNMPGIFDCQKMINDQFIPPQFKEKHKQKYKTLSDIAHPNIQSLNIHLDTNPDQQFEFLNPTASLSVWHIIEIIKFFLNLKLIKLDEENQKKLFDLQKLII